MSVKRTTPAQAPPARDLPATVVSHRSRRSRLHGLDRYGIVAVWIGVIAIFAALIPDTFLTGLTFKTLLGDQAVTCVLAVGVTVALAVGVVDLSFAALAGFAMVLVTQLSTGLRWNVVLIALVAVLACAALGAVTALLVTWLKIDSLIVTLGTMSVATGLTEAVTGGFTLTGRFSATFTAMGQGYWGPLPRPFVYALILAVLAYLVLEHTPLGRRMLAVGSNPTAARLTGIKEVRLQVAAILTSAVIAAFAGIVLAAKIGQATDSTGAGFLLPAIAAVLLGSAQFKDRVNIAGSVVAVLTLGTGIKGLELMGTSPWVSDFFDGAVLLAAVAFRAIRSRSQR